MSPKTKTFLFDPGLAEGEFKVFAKTNYVNIIKLYAARGFAPLFPVKRGKREFDTV
jgi:hypothetical protein